MTKSWESLRFEKVSTMTTEERRRYEHRKFEAEWALRLGLEVKDHREAAGLSQRRLAELVGIRQPNIARLEAGDVLPTLATLERVAEALGLTLVVTFLPAKAS